MKAILGLDPGNEQSAIVHWSPVSKQIISSQIVDNDGILEFLWREDSLSNLAIEMVAGYGMPVGKEVFETVRWIGRFQQKGITQGRTVKLVYRKEIKLHFCGTTKAKDANIRQALIDRLGSPGTKKAPGVTYGIKADMWSALAIALYADDNKLFEEK